MVSYYCSACNGAFDSDEPHPVSCRLCGEAVPLAHEIDVDQSNGSQIDESPSSDEFNASVGLSEADAGTTDDEDQHSESRQSVNQWPQFIDRQRETLSPDDEQAPSQPVPAYRLFSPIAVVVCGFIASPAVVTCLLLALNYGRLGMRVKSALAFVCSGLSLVVLFYLIIAFPLHTVFFNGFIALVAAFMVFNALQERHLSAHQLAGGKLESGWNAAGVGVLTLACISGIGFAWDWSQSFGTRLALGRGDEIFYSSGVSKEEAQRLGAFLKSDGMFDDTTPQAAVISQDGRTKLISFFLDPKDAEDPDFAKTYEEYGETISREVFDSAPVQFLFRDGSNRVYRRLTPVVGVSKKTWQSLTDAASKASDEHRYAAAELSYRAAAEEAERHQSLTRLLVTSLNNVGNMRLAQNLTDDVEPYFQRALTLANSVCGEKSYEAGYASNGLARWELQRGNVDEAIEQFRRALAIRERLGKDYREDHLDTLQSLVGLLMVQKNFLSAEDYQQQRVSLVEYQKDSEPLEMAEDFRLLGWLKWTLGRYVESQDAYKRSVEVFEQIQPRPYERFLPCLIVTGRVNHALGDFATSERHFRRAFELVDELPRPDDRLQSELYDSFAALLSSLARFDEAEVLYRRALEQRERSLGKDHVDVADVLSHLGSLQRDLAQFSESEHHLKAAIAIFERADERYRERLADCLDQFAQLHHVQRHFSEAEKFYRRALSIREEVLGQEHEKVAASFVALSELFSDRLDYGTAEPLARKGLQLAQARFGDEHPLTIGALQRLAIVLSGQRKFTSAEESFHRVLEIGPRVFGENHPYLARTRNALAIVLLEQDRYSEAQPLLEQAVKTFEEVFGPTHPNLIGAFNNLGLIHHQADRNDSAAEYLERALRTAEQLLGREHPDLLPILTNYAETLRALNQTDKARALEQRAEEIRAKLLPEIRLPSGPFVG